ncbi:HipA domain-containing protein [Caulobacter segnis]|uniref:type II toxin-antitoxin system HipA family toxin n=1 Tax=Caulobacter segnis TaxID=88688 RepID=UPI00240EDD40|nr:HipA domain-containing protein [Caulobacter segnis]MDG2520445.1 HipA domain-containing protein [Caulobacter segnis]
MHLPAGPVPCGRLTMTSEPRASFATFAYGRRYLERADRVAVDPVQLPLPEPGGEDIVFRTEEGFSNFNGIRDAAPDGWGRYLMYKALDDREPSEAEILLASGDYRVGALAFGPTPESPGRLTPWGEGAAPGEHFTLEELAAAVEEVQSVDELDDNLRRLLTAGSSLGGARPKAATDVLGQPWIAKFPANDDIYPICRIELATMRLAKHCGLDVPNLDFREVLGRDIYMIERFDRISTADGARRQPFASGLTILGAHESDVGRHSYADLADAIRRHGADPRKDLVELYRRMVFNILVTNDDDHLRNHGFLWTAQGWRLSPLYDVVPKPQVGLERTLVLGVGPRGRAATLENAIAGAGAFGFTIEDARRDALALVDSVREGWMKQFRGAGLGDAEIRRFATCFRLADHGRDLLEA